MGILPPAADAAGKRGQANRIDITGRGFYRDFGLERPFRDVRAAHDDPLQEQDQSALRGGFFLERMDSESP